jgi:hypothetical protein
LIVYDLVDKRMSLFNNQRDKDRLDVRGFYKAFFLAYYHLVYYGRIQRFPNKEIEKRERLLSQYYLSPNDSDLKFLLERQIDIDSKYVMEFLTIYKKIKHKEGIQEFQDKITIGVRKSDYKRITTTH